MRVIIADICHRFNFRILITTFDEEKIEESLCVIVIIKTSVNARNYFYCE